MEKTIEKAKAANEAGLQARDEKKFESALILLQQSIELLIYHISCKYCRQFTRIFASVRVLVALAGSKSKVVVQK